jgi:hypothetical protein
VALDASHVTENVREHQHLPTRVARLNDAETSARSDATRAGGLESL